jgi:hypothetical protein
VGQRTGGREGGDGEQGLLEDEDVDNIYHRDSTNHNCIIVVIIESSPLILYTDPMGPAQNIYFRHWFGRSFICCS